MKTIIQHFNDSLPDGIREMAISNANEYKTSMNTKFYSPSRALHGSFVWADSEEGHDFWNAVYEKLVYIEQNGK